MGPKVSVVIPVYKAEPYIKKCVRTLFSQTLDDMEFIFVDDCSPDKSIEVMEQVLSEFLNRKSQVKVIRHEVNQGVSAARQHGVAKATGEYIIHCDPDDWVEQDMYEVLYNEAKEKKADIVICDFYNHRSGKDIIEDQNPQTLNSISVIESISGRTSYNLHGSLWNKLISASCYENVIFPNVSCCEDAYVLFQILSTNRSISYVQKSLYYYNNDIPASLVKQNDLKANDSDIRLIKALQELQKKSDNNRYNNCIDSYITRIIFLRAFSWGSMSNEDFKSFYGPYEKCIAKNRDLMWLKKLLLKLAMKGHYQMAYQALHSMIALKSSLSNNR